MTQVAVAGDWHGNTNWVERAIPLIRRSAPEVTRILHLGDFGIFDTGHHKSFLDSVDYWCAHSGIERIDVTPGNHEDWAYLDSLFAEAPGEPVQLSKHVFVLPRGYRFEIAGTRFLSFGGAASVDFEYRIPGKEWWLKELATTDDVAAAVADGPTDVLLLHETLNELVAPGVRRVLSGNPLAWSAEALAYSAVSRRRVTDVWRATEPKVTFHGHMHVFDTAENEAGQRVVSAGKDGQDGNLLVLSLPDLTVSNLGKPEGRGHEVVRRLNWEKDFLTTPEG